MKGIIFIPFHFVECCANKLTIAALDPFAKMPEFKVCAAKIEVIPVEKKVLVAAKIPVAAGGH
jgi:formate dehydrogenase major subunit